jgi:gamma-glutamyl:cysteine ligase YbdK (ATP-grasp superfamily)
MQQSRPQALSSQAGPRTVGVEEEFLIVHPDGQLADQGDAVTDKASENDAGGQFEHELKRAQAESDRAQQRTFTR